MIEELRVPEPPPSPNRAGRGGPRPGGERRPVVQRRASDALPGRWVMAPQPAGNFGLVRINGAAGFWIKIGQWLNGDGFADYEHAVMALSNGQLIEAEPGGARIRSQDEYANTNIIWSDWPLTDQQRTDADREGRAREGTPYSALDYFAIAAKRLHIPIPGLRRYIRSTRHEMCSALADLISQRANIHLFQDNRWEGEVTPLSLLRALHGPVPT